MAFIELPGDCLATIFDKLSARDLANVAATCRTLLCASPAPVEDVLVLRAAKHGHAWMHENAAIDRRIPSHGNGSHTLYLARLEHIHGETHGSVALGEDRGFCISGCGSLVECTFEVPWTRRDSAPTRLNQTPLRSLVNVTITSVATGSGFTAAVSMAGCVYTWGECRTRGVLGHGAQEVRLLPSKIRALDKHRILAVATGPDHCIAIEEVGAVWSWGLNICGQCGHGTLDRLVEFPRIMQLPERAHIRSASCGDNHSLILSSEGAIFFTGTHTGTDHTESIPKVVGALLDHHIVATSAGLRHSLALSRAGVVFAWGSNSHGELGRVTQTRENLWLAEIPMVVDGVLRVHAIAAGGNTSAAVTSDGTLVMWGCGYGPEPTQIECGRTVSVAVKWNGTVAVGYDGSVFGWRNWR